MAYLNGNDIFEFLGQFSLRCKCIMCNEDLDNFETEHANFGGNMLQFDALDTWVSVAELYFCR